MLLMGFKAMAQYLHDHCDLRLHHDTLRKAVTDERNPLPVSWENGMATIEPSKLLRWRESRRGIRRRTWHSAA